MPRWIGSSAAAQGSTRSVWWRTPACPYRSIDGQVLGALCVMDDKRREWTTGELEALRDLADCVTEEIVLRTQINQLQNQQGNERPRQ